jgi:NADPH:quinone reductase
LQRFGETQRRYPEENEKIWRELLPYLETGKIKPVIYGKPYSGLESVPQALKDISQRKTWGKAVVSVIDEAATPKL